MKRIRALAIGTAFLIGIPVCLVAIGLSPLALFAHFTSLGRIMDVELFIRSVASVLLWVVWICGTTNVIIQVVTLKRGGSIEPSDHVFKKAAATFVVALWLFTTHSASKGLSREPEAKSSQIQLSVNKHEPQNDVQKSIPSAFAIMSLLSMIESSHRRKIQLSSSEMHDEPVSKKSPESFYCLLPAPLKSRSYWFVQ